MAESSAETKLQTILVVDDEAEVRALVREVLVMHGYNVIDTAILSRRVASPRHSRFTCCSPTW